MWGSRGALDTARLFRTHFPTEGPVLDLEAGDSLLRSEAHVARRIAALYWPPDFAASMRFTFNCVVFDGYEPNAFAAHRDGEHWSAMSTGMIYVLAELAVRLATVFPIHDPEEPPLDLEAAAGAGFRYDRDDFRQSHAEAARFFKQGFS